MTSITCVGHARLERLWEDEVKERGPAKASFMRVWMRAVRTRTLITLLIVTINALASFMTSVSDLVRICLKMQKRCF